MIEVFWMESDERETWWREVLGIDNCAQECATADVVERSQCGSLYEDSQRRRTGTSISAVTAA